MKPKGDALMTFEQRRGKVDVFFGPPRFGDNPSVYSKFSEGISSDDDDGGSGDVGGDNGDGGNCDGGGGGGNSRGDGSGGAWECGEELDFGNCAGGKGLGDAARAARVRMFRMKRKGLAPETGFLQVDKTVLS